MAVTIAITGMFATQTADAAKRKMVVEDHTGAWCGYCVRGMESLEKLEDEFGDEVITVAVHNGDGMAISTYQTPLAQMIGVTGYPNGSVSRINYSGKIAQSDNAWTPIVKQYIGKDVPVGVKLAVDYNKSTGAYTATITATVESTVNANLGFNLWVMQDGMTGTGSQWDQANYLSKNSSVAPTPSSKFYNEPAKIVGFVHNNVFRAATAGLEGEQGTFPAGSVPAGTYKQVYTGNVSNMNVTNNNNAFFVAVVHNKDSKEIINGDRAGKVVDVLSTDVANAYISVAGDTKHMGEVTLTNDKDWPISADITIDANKSLIPAGWGVSVSNTTVTLKAKETRKIQIEVLKNKIEGFGQIVLKVTPQESPNQIKESSATAYFMTENIENAILFGFDDGLTPIANAINTSGELTKPVLVSGAAEIIENFPQMTSFKTVIMTVTDTQFGLSTEETKTNLKYIEDLMDNGADILIATTYDLINYGNVFSDLAPTPEVVNFFSNRIGVSIGGALFIHNSQTGQLTTVGLTGISGDPISNGMSFSYNNVYNQQTYPYYARVFASVALNGKTDASVFLEADPSINQTVTNTNNKIGIKLDNNGQRTALFTLSLDAMGATNLNAMMKSTLKWLKGAGATAAGPSISLSTKQLVFGEIKKDLTGSETIKVTNSGDEALVISAINAKTGTNFTVKGSTPLTIDAGQTVNLTIDFTPTEAKNYSDEITIVSNDKANPSSVITVMGIGTDPQASVTGIIPNVFTMTVGPNPVVNSSEINLVINGSVNLDLELIDATGKVVSNIFSGVSTSNTLELDAAQLSSGTYYLNANVNGKTTQLPVVVTK